MRNFLSLSLGLLCLPVASTRGDLIVVVDSTGNTDDVIPGDGICADANSNCTLRAAIEEANALNTNLVTILLAVDSPILLDSSLPILNVPVKIYGPGEIDGGDFFYGLALAGGGSTVQGLTIHHCVYGIEIHGPKGGNLIFDCTIGTDAAGTNALGNLLSGVLISNSPNNQVDGGGTVGLGVTLISGNGGDGVHIFGPMSKYNSILSDTYIGTDATGTHALPNAGHGVFIENAPQNSVGGLFVTPQSPASVLISGNQGYGVRIEGFEAAGNFVESPSIGTDLVGSNAVPNGLGGIAIFSSPSNNVEGVLCSGNTGPGILIDGLDSVANRVTESRIGVNFPDDPLGNSAEGVLISTHASFNYVCDNEIAYNGAAGVSIISGTNNFIGSCLDQQYIFSNAGLGIDLGGDGVTTNHPGGNIDGPNQFLNHPVITAVSTTSSNITVSGTFSGPPLQLITIWVYDSTTGCDPSGYGEGEYVLGETGVFTDNSGNATFNATFDTTVADTEVITVTAVDLQNNTSEFSQCFPVGGCLITCPDDIKVSPPAGQTNAVVSFARPTVIGGCSLGFTADPSSGSTFPVGTNLVTFTGVDGSGHTNTCTFNVIVTVPDFSIQAQLNSSTCTNTTKGRVCPLTGSVVLQNNGQTYLDANLTLTQTCKTKNGITKCKLQGTITVNELDLGLVPDHNVGFYLSDDASFDSASDPLLYNAGVDAKSRLASAFIKKHKPLPVKFKVPKATDLTGKFLIIVLNPDNSVTETDTSNNIAVLGPLP